VKCDAVGTRYESMHGVGSGESLIDPPRVLPRGRHRIEREVVLASQRGRLIDAIAAAVAEKGYSATTVADVVGRAGVSRKTFYEHFEDKLDCFLAAYDTGVELLLARLQSAWERPGTFSERLQYAVEAYLGTLADAPDFACTFIIEALAAGPRALERRAAVHARFAAQIEAAHSQTGLPELPHEAFAAAVGAVNELVAERVRQGRIESLPELAGTVCDIQVRLLAGSDGCAQA
jgi:AcrR family transcriptional regulator